MAENNKVQVKYSVTSLDLSLINLAIDDLNVCDYHPIKNALLGIDDTARIIKKTIDICEEVKSTIEMGDNFKTLSDIQQEQAEKAAQNIQQMQAVTSKLQGDVSATQEEVKNLRAEVVESQTSIVADCNAIILQALERYVETSNYEEFQQTLQTQLSVMSDQILMNFTTVTEQITEVDGDMQSKFTELYEWIRIAGGVMTFGSSDSAVTLSLENDSIVFRKNGVQFGSWDGDNFYTGNIVIRLGERFQLGSFAFKPRPDESMMLVWVGA